jgi:hypothetical protein
MTTAKRCQNFDTVYADNDLNNRWMAILDLVSIKMLTITGKKFLMWVDSCLGKLEDYSIIIYEKDTETLIIYDLQLTMLIIFFR